MQSNEYKQPHHWCSGSWFSPMDFDKWSLSFSTLESSKKFTILLQNIKAIKMAPEVNAYFPLQSAITTSTLYPSPILQYAQTPMTVLKTRVE